MIRSAPVFAALVAILIADIVPVRAAVDTCSSDNTARALVKTIRSLDPYSSQALAALTKFSSTRKLAMPLPSGETGFTVTLAARAGCNTIFAAGDVRFGNGFVAVVNDSATDLLLVDQKLGATLKSLEVVSPLAKEVPALVKVVFETAWGTGFQAYGQKFYAVDATVANMALALPESDYVSSGELAAFDLDVIYFTASTRIHTFSSIPLIEVTVEATFDPVRPSLALNFESYRWLPETRRFIPTGNAELYQAETLQNFYYKRTLETLRKAQ